MYSLTKDETKWEVKNYATEEPIENTWVTYCSVSNIERTHIVDEGYDREDRFKAVCGVTFKKRRAGSNRYCLWDDGLNNPERVTKGSRVDCGKCLVKIGYAELIRKTDDATHFRLLKEIKSVWLTDPIFQREMRARDHRVGVKFLNWK
jgi:hypothetical protein|tara:strand:- start:33 stop:476 length:444 start_codon:yes stop_codon:yes gene_type:complete